MRVVIGLLSVLIGGGWACFWALQALLELFAVYDHALGDALAVPTVSEEARADRMWHAALMGLIGGLPLLVGSVLLKSALLRLLRRGRQGG